MEMSKLIAVKSMYTNNLMSSSAIISETKPLERKKRRGPPPALKLPTVPTLETPTETISYNLARIHDSFYISGCKVAQDFELLKKSGITHILNLVGENKFSNVFPEHFKYTSFCMPDNPKVNILFFACCGVDFITEALEEGGKVLVHCLKGTSRAPTLAAAYLMLKEGFSEDQAINRVRSVLPSANPNFGFICQLRILTQGFYQTGVYKYSAKYDMFIPAELDEGTFIRVENSCFYLFLSENRGLREEELGLLCAKSWERVIGTHTTIHYF
mgnify:FL=1